MSAYKNSASGKFLSDLFTRLLKIIESVTLKKINLAEINGDQKD